jgi:tetratricopeptide (TPR) repeat protein
MVDVSATGSLPTQRAIRVFVSSTFRDMQPEREELIKRTFPQLRKLCEARGVTWGEVDLRWGVTDEQKAEGQVLPICLDEIHRCRPYFIGLLGDRYGWVLDTIEPAILAREPWLANYRGRSVTEIEMASGVLDNPNMADHAFFYFRDPAAATALGAALPAEPAAEEAAAKLRALKERIRKSSLPLRENYRTRAELGEFILTDFTRLIDRLFPQDKTPDPLDRETAMHELFASNRARVYVGREDYYERLDDAARGDGPPLVVLGASGLGKSALLANWTIRYRAAHPDDFNFVHFLGASPASADWTALARRLIGELNRRFAMTVAIPDQPAALQKSLSDALRKAGAMYRLIIVLDGLNQLSDREQAPDLAWLPRDLPPRVRIVASSLPGRPTDEAVRREWRSFELPPLQTAERERLIADYLRQYAKALDRHQIEEIAAAPLAGNPLFLTALLEELRVWGVYETLPDQIRHYLASASVGDLFQRILARYEGDYDRDRPGLVRDALSAIWAARHGLSEVELRDLLGHDGDPLPAAYWSPLYVAAERSLVSRSGLLGFFHDYLREAVRERYLPTGQDRQSAHTRLADYFAARERNPRKIAELPWQLAQAQQWQRLAGVLADLPFLADAWNQNAYDVRAYWSDVNERIPDAPLKAYQPVFDNPGPNLEYFYVVSILLLHLNYASQSGKLQSYLFQAFDQLDLLDPAAIVSLGLETAANYRTQGNLDTAMSVVVGAVDVAGRSGHLPSLAKAIASQATCLQEQGKIAEANERFEEAEALTRKLDDKALLGDVLNNRAIITSRENPAHALVLFTEVERLARDAGNIDTLAACIGNEGLALLRLGNLDAAQPKFQEQERLGRSIGSMSGVQSALRGQALVYASRNDDDGAVKLLEQQAAICRRIGDKKSLAESLLLQASLGAQYGKDPAAATRLVAEHEQLCRELGDDPNLALGLTVRASFLAAQNDAAGSLAALQKADAIFRKLGDKSGLADCLTAKAQRFEAVGRGGEAMAALKEAEGLYREIGNFAGLARAIFDQARLFFVVVRMPAAALPDMRKAQALAEQHGLSSLAQEIKRYADAIGGAAN